MKPQEVREAFGPDKHLQLGQGEERAGKAIVYVSCPNPTALLAQPPRPGKDSCAPRLWIASSWPLLQSTHPFPSVKPTLDRPEDSLPKYKFAAHALRVGVLE